ncbi:hypothetical protein [Microbispora bryophytorum]|uniref:hypothetical protein n=1 Tax=Microbispora bryophytorum TaxID=1460882 RepID=UPI0033D44E80
MVASQEKIVVGELSVPSERGVKRGQQELPRPTPVEDLYGRPARSPVITPVDRVCVGEFVEVVVRFLVIVLDVLRFLTTGLLRLGVGVEEHADQGGGAVPVAEQLRGGRL